MTVLQGSNQRGTPSIYIRPIRCFGVVFTSPARSHHLSKHFMSHFRNCLLLFLILSALSFFSCKKEDNIGPAFDMIYQHEFSIPAGIGGFAVHHFYIKDLPSRYQTLLTEHNKNDADIVEIVTSAASLEGVFGDADYGLYIEKMSLRAYDGSDPSDYVEIAYREPVPADTGNALGLIPSLADSKRFLKNSRFSLDVVLWLRNTTQEETTTRLNLNLKARY